MQTFGSLLRGIRERSGMTGRAFAEWLGTSHTRIQGLEKDVRLKTVKFQDLSAWADKLKLSGDERRAFIALGLLTHIKDVEARAIWWGIHNEHVSLMAELTALRDEVAKPRRRR